MLQRMASKRKANTSPNGGEGAGPSSEKDKTQQRRVPKKAKKSGPAASDMTVAWPEHFESVCERFMKRSLLVTFMNAFYT